MPVFRVTGPDGAAYDVNAPEGATEQEAIAYIQNQQRKSKYLPEAPQVEAAPETTVLGHAKEFLKGIPSGAIGLGQTVGTGISALLPEAVEKGTRETLAKVAKDFGSPFEAEKGYEDTVSRKLGEGLGSTLPFFALGPLGTAGRVAGMGLGVAAGAGEARERAEAAGATGSDRALATFLGIGPGMLDMVAPELKWGKSIISRALAKGGVEGATEAAQQVAQNLISKGIYNPNQGAFADTLESGGYGAGTGALASILVDLALGKRARGTHAPKEEKPKEEGVAALPHYANPTMVTFPDGTTSSDPEVIKQYRQQRYEQEMHVPGETPAGPMAQGELFPDTLPTRPGERAGYIPSIAATEETAAPEPVAASEEQGQLDLSTGRTTEEQYADLEQQYKEDAAKSDVAKAEAELQRLRLELDSAIAETDARVANSDKAKVEKPRLKALERVILNDVPNIPKAFNSALIGLGYGNGVEFTADERRIINKAIDVKLAEPEVEEVTPGTDVRAETDKLEALIPEKGAKPTPPGQMSFPGMGKPKGEVVTEAEPEVAPTETLNKDFFDRLGVSPKAPIRTRLEGLSLADPDQRTQARADLLEFSLNPNIKAPIRNAVKGFIDSDIFRTQGEMFGPRGGIEKGAIPPTAKQVEARKAESAAKLEAEKQARSERAKKGVETRKAKQEAERAVPRTEPAGAGVSAESGVGVRGKREAVPERAVRTEAPKPGRLANREQPTGKSRVREGQQRAALKEETEAKIASREWDEQLNKLVKTSSGPTLAEILAAKKKATKKLVLDATQRFNNLMSWFGNSAVATEDGKPLVVYTGTSKDVDFPKFKIPKNGAWFTTDTKDASDYAKDNDSQGMKYEGGRYVPVNTASRVIPVYLKIENPYKLTEADFKRINVDNYKRAQGQLFDELRAKGYDGIDFGHGIWVVLGSPTQVKSAVGNLGTFDPSNANMVKLEGASALAIDVPTEVQSQLKNGDIKGALLNLAGKLDGIAGRITQQLANVIGDTRVEVVNNLKDESGNSVAGLFDPNTNTIKLDSKAGVNSHTVIHEAVHAATSHILENPNHIVTKQLQKLFDDVKGSLDTAYGSTSLDEFVAEAFSNPEFQAKLNAINPKGEPITAWQRFTNTIKNFVRKMIGMDATGLTSMDKADELISAILSPSPETRDAGSLYMKSMLGKGAEWVDSVIKGRSVLPSSPNLDAYHEFFTGTVPNKAKEAIRAALPLNALVDVAKKYIPMAPKVDALVNQKSASESTRNDKLHNSIMDVSRWASKQTEAVMKAFNNTVYNSTIDQVDPSKPRDTYKGDKEKLKFWDDAQADWKAIGPEGQSMYKMMRDTYKGMYDEIQKILGIRIDESMADPATSKKIKAEIYKRLAERGGLEPYFPLTRSGKYWLSYHLFNERTQTPELYVEAFESTRARDRAMEELGKNGATEIQKFANFKDVNYKNAPPTSFANAVLKTLEANKVDNETTEQVMRLFLDTLPETSFAQAFRQRKGTLGFETDAVKAFKMKAHSISRQLSNMEYGAKLATLKREISEYVKKSGSDEATVQFADELGKRIDFAMSPNVPYWSKVATAIGFNMTLGFNVSSALVNMTQIPLVTMPYLGGKYGYSETSKALGRAAKIFTNSGTDRMIETYVPSDKGEVKRKVKAFWSLDNYDFSKHPELKHLETLSNIAADMGQLNRSQIYDVLDVDESDSLLSKVNAASGLVFHHGERMNRQVSLIAAYELELQKLVGKGKDLKSATKEQMEAAAHEAIYLTELTNGGVSAAAAPRLAQNALGKVMFMFKRYGVSMYYMMFKTAKEALKSADPEVRKQAMKQIAGIYGSSALIAGVKGIPMFGIAAMIFNMFRDDDEDDFETATRKWMGEIAYKGPVNALTGLEIAGRVGLSDLLFRDQGYNKDQTAIQSFMEMAGGPVFGVASRIERGLSLIGEGETQRGVEQMLPSAIGNGLKAIRYATEGTQTLRGDPVTGEVGPWNVFAQGLGFAPADYIQQLERNAAIKKIDRKSNEQRTKLLRQYYIALREGDLSGAQDTMSEVMKFNRKHPGAAITGETIKNSMAQHKKTSATMYHGITISKNMKGELMGNIAEYDNGIDLFD